ncbi:hypothetical protein MKW98_021787, partial [Papaver atlanticum]
QNMSVVSFFDGEGYNQQCFHFDSSLDSARIISEAWLVEENNFIDDAITEIVALPPSQPFEEQLPFSPSIFLVSDIEESELLSENEMPSPTQKRLNPKQQIYLHNACIGSSSGSAPSRRVTHE